MHAAVGLLAVTVIFVGRNLFRYGAELLAAGAPLELLGVVLRCVCVASLTYTLPIAFLFGVLAGVARLAEDRETLALDVCGLGLSSLVLPVLGLGLLVSAAAALLALDLEPRAKRELRSALSSASSAPLLEAGRFTSLGDRTLWVGARNGTRVERVFASDRSRPERPVWVFAETGFIRAGSDTRGARLELRNGDLHLASEKRRVRIAFESFELPLHDAASARWQPRPKDLSTPELRRVVAGWRDDPGLPRPAAHEVQLERRLALPAAPLLFGLTAVPLALQRRRGARSWSVLCSIALVLGYYAVLASGTQLALAGLVSPRLGLWSPNLLLACTGALLALRDRCSQGQPAGQHGQPR